jgi:hypothetical protein
MLLETVVSESSHIDHVVLGGVIWPIECPLPIFTFDR